MRVADLHPGFSVSPPGGFPNAADPTTGCVTFAMDCPFCGPPMRLSFPAFMVERSGYHRFTVEFRPMIDWDTLTVTPSVNFTSGQAHGRKHPCAAHFTITNGLIIPAVH